MFSYCSTKEPKTLTRKTVISVRNGAGKKWMNSYKNMKWATRLQQYTKFCQNGSKTKTLRPDIVTF